MDVLNLLFFIKGALIGFAIAAPVGPIGILCIRRTLLNGLTSGVATGFGAAMADSLYGAVAAFSLTKVSVFLQHYAVPIQVAGAFFLIYLALKIFAQKPKGADKKAGKKKRRHGAKEIMKDFVTSFFLTLANPATVLSFMAVFAGLGLLAEEDAGYTITILMVVGVFIGSLIWWCLLSGGISLVRHKLNQRVLRLMNIISALIIGSFGIAIMAFLALGK